MRDAFMLMSSDWLARLAGGLAREKGKKTLVKFFTMRQFFPALGKM
jgi:hypothetical protein